MLKKLEDKNFDLCRLLFSLKQSLDIYRVIAVNADQLNNAGVGKSFFAYVQALALDSSVVNICKLVEKEKKPKECRPKIKRINKGYYELNSIPGVIRYLQEENILCRAPDSISVFSRQNGLRYEAGKEVETLKGIFEKFYHKNIVELERLKGYRDKRIAHFEYISMEKKVFLSSYAVMDGFLKFGIEFYSTVQQAYVGRFPIQIKDEQKVLNGLLYLLELKGIKKVKNDFQD